MPLIATGDPHGRLLASRTDTLYMYREEPLYVFYSCIYRDKPLHARPGHYMTPDSHYIPLIATNEPLATTGKSHGQPLTTQASPLIATGDPHGRPLASRMYREEPLHAFYSCMYRDEPLHARPGHKKID